MPISDLPFSQPIKENKVNLITVDNKKIFCGQKKKPNNTMFPRKKNQWFIFTLMCGFYTSK